MALPNVTIEEGIATVDFMPQALETLNTAAGIQMQVKAAIEASLLQFSTVDWVQYSINGEVYTEWDA